MNLTRHTIAAALAVVLIGGFGIAPVSAAVRTSVDTVDINRVVRDLKLKSAPLNPKDRVAPKDDVQLAKD